MEGKQQKPAFTALAEERFLLIMRNFVPSCDIRG